MRSEKEIKARLKQEQKGLKETIARFEEWDNHEDMDLIPVYKEAVSVLMWVLSKPIKEKK